MSTAVSLPPVAVGAERRLVAWWPLAALIVLAAGLRLATLDQQSLWYDEAYTPVHVLHPSLWATLRSGQIRSGWPSRLMGRTST